MTPPDANPWVDAAESARALVAARAPFYATVVSVASPLITVTPVGSATDVVCDVATAVAATAIAGTRVLCIPVGARTLAAVIVAT